MVYAIAVTPVLDIAIGPDSLDNYCLLGLAKSQYQEYLIARRYLQGLAEPVPIYRAYYTATQALLGCAQKDILSCYPVVAPERTAYLSVAEDNDIG